MKPRRAVPALVTVLLPILLALLLLALVPAVFAASSADAAKDAPAAAKVVPAAPPDRAADLAEREKAVKADEERLLALRKEVDGKITKYEKLLSDVEAKEKGRREEDEAKVDTLVKLFEGMTPECGRSPARSPGRGDGRLHPLEDERAQGQQRACGHGSEAGCRPRPQDGRRREKFSRAVIIFPAGASKERLFA